MLRILRIAAIGITVGFGLVAPAPAYADGYANAQCSDGTTRPGCVVTARTTGQQTRTTSARGGDGTCRGPDGKAIPCERDGGWAGSDGCYYQAAELSLETIAGLGGQPAGAGGWYQRACYDDSNPAGTQILGGPVWIAGGPPVVTPEVLARQARARLRLPTVVIRLNPAGDQLANLPVWLSLDPASWQARSATAAVPGVSVTATARPVRAMWAMGEGGTVTCAGPGTVWVPGTDPRAASPDCGYTYRRSSAGVPGGRYRVVVTVTWEVTWAGAGQSGTLTGLTTTASVTVRVQESQALVTN